MTHKQPLVEINGLKKHFKVGKHKILKAVDGVSFAIHKGETFGLVGESGCGKTTCGRSILGMYDLTDGSVAFDGIALKEMDKTQRSAFKKRAQMIFQDPYASLDPRMTIAEIIAEGMDVHFKLSPEERSQRIDNLLETVGLTSEHGSRFPHELSGGQRQRIGIARALAVEPEFIMCDEPISALDVSIQAQIINLLMKLQRDRGLTYLFVAHDLSMVKHISDRVGVMYLGSLVELARNHTLYSEPLHPYTQALISAIPIPDPDVEVTRSRIPLTGEVPSPINTPEGCKFVQRCHMAIEVCRQEMPALEEVRKGHFVACHCVKPKGEATQ